MKMPSLCLLVLGTFFLFSGLRAETPPDIFFYNLEIKIDPDLQRLAGTNRVRFRALGPMTSLRLDLVSSLKVIRVEQNGRKIRFAQAGGEVIIFLAERLTRGEVGEVAVLYGGVPAPEAGRSGLAWSRVQGKAWFGASPGHQPESWWPCRVRDEDPVDSMYLSIITPPGLMAVTQGDLGRYGTEPGGFRRWEWHIPTQLSPREISFYAGPYVHFVQDYRRGTRAFPLNYYALSTNKAAAKETFGRLNVPAMLSCLEQYLGPYPYPEAGYAFVETPSASQGLPGLIPFSRETFESDFGPALLRETSRQWLGFKLAFNGEEAEALGASLRAYVNVLSMECRYGKDSADAYLAYLQQGYSSSNGDFRKLAFWVWAWQNLRYQVKDDSLFLETLRLLANLNPTEGFTATELTSFLEDKLSAPAAPILNQFIFTQELPILAYTLKKKRKKLVMEYAWVGARSGFVQDIKVIINGVPRRIAVKDGVNQTSFSVKNRDAFSFGGQEVWFLTEEVKKLD